jgi:hypothetical protein
MERTPQAVSEPLQHILMSAQVFSLLSFTDYQVSLGPSLRRQLPSDFSVPGCLIKMRAGVRQRGQMERIAWQHSQ